MCGRFALATDENAIVEEFSLQTTFLPPTIELAPRYNIAPSQPILTIYQNTNKDRQATHFQWGLVPSWAKEAKIGAKMINARSETVAEKPSFRAAFKRRRCIIPASGFYEWQKTADSKQPIYIHPQDAAHFAFAGLWERWQSPDGSILQTCTILTTRPNELMTPIHNRMPVILEPEDYADWLEPEEKPQLGLHLLRPFPAERMATYPVSKLVNNPRNESPDCIVPLRN